MILLNPDKSDAANNRLEMLRVNDFTILFGNPLGIVLPETGWPGAGAYYAAGAGIVIGAGLMLAKRKKKEKEA